MGRDGSFLQESICVCYRVKPFLVGGWDEDAGRSLDMFFNYIAVVPKSCLAPAADSCEELCADFLKILFLWEALPKAACGILVS